MILFVSVTIVTVSYITGTASVYSVFDQYAASISDRAIERSVEYFLPAERTIREFSAFLSLFAQGVGARNLSDQVERGISAEVDTTLRYMPSESWSRSGLSPEVLVPFLTGQLERYYPARVYQEMVMATHREFRNIAVGGFDHDYFGVYRMPDGSLSAKYILRFGYQGRDWVVTIWAHSNADYYVKDVRNPISGVAADYKDSILPATDPAIYDPTTRSWYKDTAKAMKTARQTGTSQPIVWTPPRVFFSDEVPGITGSLGISDATGGPMYAIELTMGLTSISKNYLSNLKLNHDSQVFILSDRGEVIAYSPGSSDTDEAQILPHLVKMTRKSGGQSPADFTMFTPDQMSTPLFSAALKASGISQSQDRGLRLALERSKKFAFKSAGVAYTGLAAPFPSGFYWKWFLFIVTPEDYFIGTFKLNTLLMIALSLVGVLVAVLIAIYLSAAITRPLALLTADTRRIKLLNLEANLTPKTFIYEINELQDSMENLKLGLKSFAKYVPVDVVRYLIKSGHEAILGGETKNLTVLFADVADFTSISEGLSSRELIDQLGAYLNEMSSIIQTNHGTIDKYIGDAIMAIWGAPQSLEDHAYHACKTALECQKNLSDLRLRWAAEGKPQFRIRIGINTGDLIVGNIGAPDRMNYTVIGDTVNVASRLEDLNRYYRTEILCSESTADLVRDKFMVRRLDRVKVKGKGIPVDVFELRSSDSNPSDMTIIRKYEESLGLYFDRHFTDAREGFAECATLAPSDIPTKIFLDRCCVFLRNPPPLDWSGVYDFNEGCNYQKK
jgi:adenylate cyclase